MPTIIDEGRLRFTFPDHWPVVKYDETTFYREKITSTSANLKAVDFMAVPHPELNTLLLIEVKDFRDHAAENKERIVSGDLVLEIIEKAMHTLSAIHLVNYCHDGELINFATDLLTPPAKIELVLFMEEDSITVRGPNDTKGKVQKQNQKTRINDMTLSLRRKLKDTVGIRSKILNTQDIKPRDGFLVTHI